MGLHRDDVFEDSPVSSKVPKRNSMMFAYRFGYDMSERRLNEYPTHVKDKQH